MPIVLEGAGVYVKTDAPAFSRSGEWAKVVQLEVVADDAQGTNALAVARVRFADGVEMTAPLDGSIQLDYAIEDVIRPVFIHT
jgi:hypothetical protein